MDFRARPVMKDVVARLEEASTLTLPLDGGVGSLDMVGNFDSGGSDLASGDLTGMTEATIGTCAKSESELSKNDKYALLAEKDALLAEKDVLIALLAEKDARLAEKDALLAENDARFLEMQAKIQ